MRNATQDDLKLVHEIYTDETVTPFMSYAPVPLDKFSKIFDELCTRDHFWIFKDDNNVECAMGSALRLKGRCNHTAEIRSIAIKKEFQNQGLGRKIMEKIIAHLKTTGYERLQLNAEADNPKAIHLYNTLGFAEEGRLKNYLKRSPEEYVDNIIFAMIV